MTWFFNVCSRVVSCSLPAWCCLSCHCSIDKGSHCSSWRYSTNTSYNYWFRKIVMLVTYSAPLVPSFGNSQTTSWYGCGCSFSCSSAGIVESKSSQRFFNNFFSVEKQASMCLFRTLTKLVTHILPFVSDGGSYGCIGSGKSNSNFQDMCAWNFFSFLRF